jgi:hypothetical protein
MTHVRALLLTVLGMMAAPSAADPVLCPVRDFEALAQAELSDRIYACFGAAAANIVFRGARLDRLTVLARLATEPDPATRRELFVALQPVWQSMDGDGPATSAWRALNRLHAETLHESGTSTAARAAALGVDPAQVEHWLVAVLEAWRDALAERELEPWDFFFEAGAMERALAPHLPLAALRPLNDRVYRDLGADPVALGIEYDIAPRPGKDPVAFTDFVVRQRALPDGTWSGGRYRVSASYAVGGAGNLAELLHETGHGIHIAAIRAQPGLVDWPDSDTFTEALADLVALDLYEPAFQRRYLGAAVPRADALRAKYAGIVLDTVWALFEIRMQADPARDPNEVWTGLTHTYLRIRPHPEWSWWAMRGQLVSDPGYMLNYALGAILIADLRARTRELFGAKPWGDVSWYDRVSARLLRFGLERPSRQVIEDYLGREVSPDALLAELGKAARAAR